MSQIYFIYCSAIFLPAVQMCETFSNHKLKVIIEFNKVIQ